MVGGSRIASRLSSVRATTIQRFDGSRVGSVLLHRLFPGQMLRLAPRGNAPTPAPVADVARPIRFPQRGRGVTIVDHLPATTDPQLASFVRGLRRRRRVIVDTAQEAAAIRDALLVVAAAGAPIEVGDPARELVTELGPELTSRLDVRVPDDRQGRELHSVRIRRLAHDRLWGSEPARQISVLLASRRPADVEGAVDQVRSQVGCAVQVLVGLHGDGWPDDTDALAARLPDGSSIERFDARMTLGGVLTALAARADADLVTKWDDDDWYGSDHLADLIRAYEYSGADVVGKAAEFVHLEATGITVRRFTVGAESYSWTLAGGTLLTSKAWLDEVGQWPEVRSGVDRALLAATRQAGGTAYRTHGFQYVLRRRSDRQHTWAVDDAHFIAAARQRRPGLDLEFADIRPGDGRS